MLHGYLRDIRRRCLLKKRIFGTARKEGKSQELEAPQGEFTTKTSDVAGEESCGCLRNGFVQDGKRRQSNAKAWYGRLSLPDIF